MEAGDGSAVVAVDAPLVIRNRTGIRDSERAMNQEFRRFHAGAPRRQSRPPFCPKGSVVQSEALRPGFGHGAEMNAREKGRFQIEVHPHAATVNLFNLPRIVKYKRGRRASRARELRRLRRLMLSQLPLLHPALSLHLSAIPHTGKLKPVEDQIDAVLCSYIAAHWWFWGIRRNRVYGCGEKGLRRGARA